ncbi:methyl-accepting chemotaxis protein [Clostridium sp.]|uniref:methyl-accepting chemotaxis protein n=1 Tax=Clostridium sp. TaxID=1506 RepID=UPI00284F37FF|nr:methyl-accepting chemotaxis protein [Clostridium sp.]MDR3596148.1 methyl-accepting chemotaxis protein [Clostridium sp.]
MKSSKLFRKIVIGIVVLIIVPILLSGEAAIIKSKASLEDNLKTTSIQTIKEVDKGFSQYLQVLGTQMDIISKNIDIKDLSDPKSDHQLTVKYVQGIFKDTKASVNGIINAGFAGENGELVLDGSVLTLNDLNYKEREWYKKAKDANGKAIYIKPYKDAVTGKQVMTVAQAVKDDNGQFLGVIVIDMSLDAVQEYISGIQLLNTGYVLLVDSDGDIIVNNDRNKEIEDKVSDLSFWNSAKGEDRGVYTFETNGKSFYTCQETNEKTGWKLVGIIDSREVDDNMTSIHKTMIIISIALLIIGVLIAIIAALYLMKEIHKLKNIITKASNGDFTERIVITAKDEFKELGDDFNNMLDSLSKLLQNVKNTSSHLIEASVNIASMSEETTSSIAEVSNAIQEVATGATNQAQFATDIASNTEELSDRIDEVDKHTGDINNLSNTTKDLSDHGIVIIRDLIDKARNAKNNAIKSAGMVNEMMESINKINYISDAIGSITEQTNLLALNASIEAARAGEAGKGFAVVAEEIRKLAEESKKSTDEIKAIVSEISTNGMNTKVAMEESKEMSQAQGEAIIETEGIFNKIVESIMPLAEAIEGIKDLNEKMHANKEKVKSQIENIAAVSEESASISEEVTASTEQVSATMDELTQYANNLENIADELKEKMSKFTLK